MYAANDGDQPDVSTQNLCWTDQARIGADVTVEVANTPPSEVWASIATADSFQEALAKAVRTLLADASRMRPLELVEQGVTALDGGYARFAAGLDRGPSTDAYQQALDLTAQLGQDGMSVLGHAPLETVQTGPLALLEAADRSVSIAVRVGEEFCDRDKGQRETILWLLGEVARQCEVWLVSTKRVARWLANTHRSDLPSSFSESLNAPHQAESPVDELVATARSELDPECRPVRLLRRLAEEPGETLSYTELCAQATVSKTRVSQVLSTLEELSLVDRFGSRGTRRVELLPAGSAFLDALDEDLGRQATLDTAFSETRQPAEQAVYNRAHEGASGGDSHAASPGSSSEASLPYRTRYAGQLTHTPVASSVSNGDIVTVEAPLWRGSDASGISEKEFRHTRLVSYDDQRDEAVVSVHAASSLMYSVSMAIGLASPRFFDEALPVSRLEAIELPGDVLRDARCIGALPSEAEDDPEVLRDRLVEWGEDLAEMTTDLRHEQYDDRDRFRGEILRSALGLAGTIVHLLDVAGVDVAREVRVPSGLSDDALSELARTISISTAIQSKYGTFTVYRQVFEDRDRKRTSAMSPEIDPTDPLGTYIGGLVVRGPDAHRLGQHIEGMLSSPKPVHEDAPEISVRVSVETVDRSAFAEAMTRVCRRKNLSVTGEAVTLFRALTEDPYAAVRALRGLRQQDHQRDLALDEIRTALATLDSQHLLPKAPPTVSKAVAVLLRTATPLSQTELAEAADVSTRSLQRHLDVLEALDLVRKVDEGYRFALATDSSESDQEELPNSVDDEFKSQDLVYRVAEALVHDPLRFGDPDDPLSEAFMDPIDYDSVTECLPSIKSWIRVACLLVNEVESSPNTVSMGPDISTRQVSIDTGVRTYAD